MISTTTTNTRTLGSAVNIAALIILAALSGISCASSPPTKQDLRLSDLVIQGDTEGIKKFYANQEQLNTQDGQGLYPLHYAVSRGDPQVVEILIVLGAKPDVQDPAGKTPLRYAVDRTQIDTARLLSARGADPFIVDKSGISAAEAALSAGRDMTAAVFNAQNINHAGADGRTGLHIAADKLLENALSQLVNLAAQIDLRDRAGRSPLDLALLHPDKIEAARIAEKLIQKGASPSFPEFDWFAVAARSVDYSSVRYANGNSPLHEATLHQQYGFVSFLLARKISPTVLNLGGDAPLHLAVRAGWLLGTELLLSAGADPDIRDGKENTPLHLAVSTGQRQARQAMTRLLLRFKADPSLKDAQGNTALHRAVALNYGMDIVQVLLDAASPVNAANLAGDSPLLTTLTSGNYQYAAPLVKAGADILLKNVKGESPFSVAVMRGAEAVDTIVCNDNVHTRDNDGNSILAAALALKASPDVIQLLIDKGIDVNARNNTGDSALHMAVRNNMEAQGLVLLHANADIFIANSTAETPLLSALSPQRDWFFIPQVLSARDQNGDTALHYAARRNMPDGIEYLMSRGADSTAVNAAKETVLHHAVKADAVDAARFLLASGADLSARDAAGDGPLNSAVLHKAQACLPVLVLSGANLDMRNFSGEAALHQAVRKNNTEALEYLLSRNADKEARDGHGMTALAAAAQTGNASQVKMLLGSGAQIDARDNSGATPLVYAMDKSSLETQRLLVSSGADILAKNALGASPFSLALKKSPSQFREMLSPASINRADAEGKTPLRLLVDAQLSEPSTLVNILIAAGARLDARDRFGETPLVAAMRAQEYATAAQLVKAGADPFARNYAGASPASIAIAAAGTKAGEEALTALVAAAGIQASDIQGNSFLHYAARAGSLQAVELLLALGADKAARTQTGERAADIALSGNYPDLAARLR